MVKQVEEVNQDANPVKSKVDMERAMQEKVEEVAADKEMLKNREAERAAKAEDIKDAAAKAKVDDEAKATQTHMAVKDMISNR